MTSILPHFCLVGILLISATCRGGEEEGKEGPYLELSIPRNLQIAGAEVATDRPPAGFQANRQIGLLHHEAIRLKLIHANREGAAYTPRAVKTPRGDYLVVFPCGWGHMWAGKNEKNPNDLYFTRSTDQGRTWSNPTPKWRAPYGYNSGVFLIPSGSERIYLFGVEMHPDWRRGYDGGIAYRYSDDDGRTWSKPHLIEPTNDRGYRGLAHIDMTQTPEGTWLLGTYEARSRSIGIEQRIDRQYILRSEDQGGSWTLLPGPRPGGWKIDPYGYMIEGRPLALGGSEVLFWGRAPGGHPWEFRSVDDGRTWSGPVPVKLVHPDAPPMIWKLDGRLIAVIHNSYDPKNPKHDHTQRRELWVALSGDGAKTWTPPRLMMASIAESGGPLRSPSISYDNLLIDGQTLHLFIDYQFRAIVQATFTIGDLEKFPLREEFQAECGRQ
jgi:hypothetical protein